MCLLLKAEMLSDDPEVSPSFGVGRPLLTKFLQSPSLVFPLLQFVFSTTNLIIILMRLC